MTESIWGADVDLWRVIPVPFTPSREDLELYRRACPPELLRADSAPRVLVLGVTHPLVNAPWPPGTELHAVDYDEAMIASLWVPREGAQVHLAWWQDMPFPDSHFDLVIGDGAFNALPAVADYADVLRQIDRVRKPRAPLVSRFFMQSDPPPVLDQIVADVSGRLAGHSAAAKRLLVFLACANPDGSWATPDTPGRIRELWGDYDEFLETLGDPPDEVALSKVVHAFDQRLNYPTERQIRERFMPYFDDIAFAYPGYDVGQHCPTVRFA